MRKMVSESVIRKDANGEVVLNNAATVSEDGVVTAGKRFDADYSTWCSGGALSYAGTNDQNAALRIGDMVFVAASVLYTVAEDHADTISVGIINESLRPAGSNVCLTAQLIDKAAQYSQPADAHSVGCWIVGGINPTIGIKEVPAGEYRLVVTGCYILD